MSIREITIDELRRMNGKEALIIQGCGAPLQERGAHLFCMNRESCKPQAVARIAREGHALGMHSYNHQYEEVYASREAFAEDYHKIQDYLFQL